MIMNLEKIKKKKKYSFQGFVPSSFTRNHIISSNPFTTMSFVGRKFSVKFVFVYITTVAIL